MADDREVYDEETAEVMDLSKDEVVTKYRTAADIANNILSGLGSSALMHTCVTVHCSVLDSIFTDP